MENQMFLVVGLDKETQAENESRKRVTQIVNDAIHKYAISVDSFLMGAVKELYDMNYLIVKKQSRSLLNELFTCLKVDEAKEIADEFARSLVFDSYEENIYDNPTINSFLSDAPIYKLLFVENSKNKTYEKIKQALYDNDSREQRILYSVMNMSYFENIKDEKSAYEYINTEMERFGFKELDKENDFDSLIIDCIKEENRINIDNNLDFNIGGMRVLSRYLNGEKLFPELRK